jgi:hypothetical protein
MLRRCPNLTQELLSDSRQMLLRLFQRHNKR